MLKELIYPCMSVNIRQQWKFKILFALNIQVCMTLKHVQYKYIDKKNCGIQYYYIWPTEQKL